jgi:hypothetical protein
MTNWERAALPLNGLMAGIFGSLSALRGKRIFHPDGAAYRATLTMLPADRLDPLVGFAAETTSDAYVRFSRGVGLPEKIPDILGLAIKVPLFAGAEIDQDLLMVTSGEGPVMQNLLLPAAGYFGHHFSSVLPYRRAEDEDGDQILFGARADAELDGHDDRSFQDIANTVAVRNLRFDLLTARIGDKWKKAGSLVVTKPLEEQISSALRYNPWNSHPDLIPAGPFNTWRRAAYAKSQDARPDT